MSAQITKQFQVSLEFSHVLEFSMKLAIGEFHWRKFPWWVCILTVALDPMFVERKALITLATETADRVLASSVQAHSRELDAFVDILPVREASPSWT